MTWYDPLIVELSARPCCGYQADDTAAAEPTALAALALAGFGRTESAMRAAAWLVDLQAGDGSVGVRVGETTPRWPTGLAVLAWLAVDPKQSRFGESVNAALAWILSQRSKAAPRGGAMQHDTSLVAWPWVEGTHAWVEPTSLNVLALKATGRSGHRRTREAVALLLDRQLPAGGCNYGNTRVLGQQLRPHLLPSGLALLALAGEDGRDPRIKKTVHYVSRSVSASTPAVSLCWAFMGLAAHGRSLPQAEEWLSGITARAASRFGSPWKTALLLLAALGDRSPLVRTKSG